MTIFDNGAAPPVEKFSRVLVLRVDMKSKRVTLVRSYRHPKKLLAPFEGNAQFLDNGHILVGWGAWPNITEHLPDGRVIFEAYFGHGKKAGKDADTYRAFRMPWQGKPLDRPALVVRGGKAYVSWNGATEVARWQVLSGQSRALAEGRKVPKRTFETAIPISPSAKFVAVRALDAKGNALATSATIEVK
jgi:hypothetical protein